MTTEPTTGGEATNAEIEWTPALEAEFERRFNERAAGLQRKNGELIAEWKTLKAEKAERERKEAEARGDYDKVISSMQEQFTSRETALRSQLEAYVVDAEAMAAINAAGGIAPLLMPHVKSKVRVVEREGKFAAEVDGGKSIREVVEAMKADPIFAPAFRSPVANGGGAATGTNAPPVQRNPFAKETMNLTEAAKLERDQPELAKTLKAQAGWPTR